MPDSSGFKRLDLRGLQPGGLLPFLGHQGHLSPVDVLVEPAWSPGSKDAILTRMGGIAPLIDLPVRLPPG